MESEDEDEVEETPQVAKIIKMPKVKKEPIKLKANQINYREI